jgi:predicted membrane protein
MQDPNTILNNREKNLCEFTAIAGVLLTLTCLVQHLIVTIPNSLTNLMIAAYPFMIVAFLLLGLQKPISIVFVIIGAALSALLEFLWIMHYAFSLVVLLLFMFHTVIVIVLFMEKIPRKLKMKRAAQRAEADAWADKI